MKSYEDEEHRRPLANLPKKVRSNRVIEDQFPATGLSFRGIEKCRDVAFDQSCRECQCTTVAERRQLEFLLSLKALCPD